MENATKALLIAASVLIVILLIAFGMRIFNSTKDTTDSVQTTMNATEIATFNSKFTAYAGSGKSAAQVKALANVVIGNNATSTHKVIFDGADTATGITAKAANYTNGPYKISVSTDDHTGLVTEIIISTTP